MADDLLGILYSCFLVLHVLLQVIPDAGENLHVIPS